MHLNNATISSSRNSTLKRPNRFSAITIPSIESCQMAAKSSKSAKGFLPTRGDPTEDMESKPNKWPCSRLIKACPWRTLPRRWRSQLKILSAGSKQEPSGKREAVEEYLMKRWSRHSTNGVSSTQRKLESEFQEN